MASPAEIVAALDTAILNWAGSPVKVQEQGSIVEYRSLADLVRARGYYANLAATASSSSHGFRLTLIRAPGAMS